MRFKLRPAALDQVIPDVPADIPILRHGGLQPNFPPGERFGQLNCRFRHPDFGLAGGGGQFFHYFAVHIPRGKIHPGICPIGVAAQLQFDQAQALEKIFPILGRQRPQADKAVGHDVGRGYILRPGQPLGGLCGQPGLVACDRCQRLHLGLYHHQAQQGGQRPQFAHRQGVHLLVGMDEQAHFFQVQARPGIGDQFARHQVNARPTSLEAGQLAAVRQRQRLFDHADGLGDEVIVIQQPLRRIRDDHFLVDGTAEILHGQVDELAVARQVIGQDRARPARPGVGIGFSQLASAALQVIAFAYGHLGEVGIQQLALRHPLPPSALARDDFG